MDHIAQARPGSDLMALPGFGRTHPVRKQAGLQEPSGPASGRTQPARYHFRTLRLGSVLSDVPNNTEQNQPGSDLVLTDCVRFWANGSSPEASQCARIIQPASGQCFPADPDRMRIGSSMFTGYTVSYTTLRQYYSSGAV